MSAIRIVDDVDGSFDDIVVLTDEQFDALSEEEQRLIELYWQREFYKRNPVAWGVEKLGETWWSAQKRIVNKVQIHRKLAVKSCHEIGKDFIAARAACHWIDAGTPGKRAVVTTAAHNDQVKVVLWKEINQAHKKGRLIGRVTLTEWHLGNEIVGFGRKVADYNPTNFHGMHAPEGVLVIYDEACGVNEAIFQAGNSMAGNFKSHQLAIGNPDDPDSYFASLFLPDSDWETETISAYDSPNFTDERYELPKEVLDSLIDRSYVDGLIKEYGDKSPIVISKVHGNFPEDAKDGVVPWSKLQQSMLVEYSPDEKHDLGIDIGATEEGDGDATVIRERIGNKPLAEWVVQSSDPEIVAGEIIRVINETGATRAKVDSIGIGWGICGLLNSKRKDGVHNCKIFPVNVSESAHDKKNFPNLRSEIWWEIAREPIMRGERCNEGLDTRTQAELIAPQYKINTSGQRVVEPKADTKKRLRHLRSAGEDDISKSGSPDHADAYNLSFYEPRNTGKGQTSGAQVSAARIG